MGLGASSFHQSLPKFSEVLLSTFLVAVIRLQGHLQLLAFPGQLYYGETLRWLLGGPEMTQETPSGSSGCVL